MFNNTRSRILSALALLLTTVSCMSYRAAPNGIVAPQRDIKLVFGAPVVLTMRCDSLSRSDTGGTCSDSLKQYTARDAAGQLREWNNDSLLVLVTSLHDSHGRSVKFSPGRLTRVARGTTGVEERHVNVGGTVLLVIGLIGAVAAVAGAVSQRSEPAPKDSTPPMLK